MMDDMLDRVFSFRICKWGAQSAKRGFVLRSCMVMCSLPFVVLPLDYQAYLGLLTPCHFVEDHSSSL